MSAPRPEQPRADWGIRDAVPSWAPYLQEFDTHAWPLFERHGYSKDAALLAWHLNQITAQLERLGYPPDEEPWR